MNLPEARISDLALEIDIKAKPDAVWRSLTVDIGAWWPAEFYAGGAAGKRRFVLEAEPGGRMYEEWDDGGGLLWATVVAIEPLKRLRVTGFQFPDWGGPSQWYGTWELSAAHGTTRLKFSESTVGRVTDRYVLEKNRGWTFLGDALKAWLEGTPPPAWAD